MMLLVARSLNKFTQLIKLKEYGHRCRKWNYYRSINITTCLLSHKLLHIRTIFHWVDPCYNRTLLQPPFTNEPMGIYDSLMRSGNSYYSKKAKKDGKIDYKVGMGVVDIKELEGEMDRIMERLSEEYVSQLTLRTSAGALDHIKVQTAYGVVNLNELGQISSPSPQLITINMASTPECTDDVVKTICKSGMGLNPQIDGNILKIAIPRVTLAHREKLAKTAKLLAGNTKRILDNVRNNTMRHAEGAVKSNSLTRDDMERIKEVIQLLLKRYKSRVDAMMHEKQKELDGSV